VFIFRVVRGPFVEEFYQCVTYGFYTAPWQEQLYASISLMLMFVLPLTTLVATYAATFHTIANLPAIHCGESERPQPIHSQHRLLSTPGNAGPEEVALTCSTVNGSHLMEAARRRLLAKAKKKSLMITVVIVVAFIVCWTPYYAMMVIFIFNLDPDQQITGELQSAIFFFGSSTAMINPVIYGVFHLRRPRTSKMQHTTVVLSSTSFRKPHANNKTLTTAIRRGDHSQHQHLKRYLIDNRSRQTPPIFTGPQDHQRKLVKVEVEVRLEGS
ncbi:gonadotropin-releasing hormone receptor-like, partial [Tropilaelaps mercedesae]